MKAWLMRATAISLFFFASLVHAHEREQGSAPLLRAAYVNFPPLSYTDVNGEPSGYYVTMAEQAALQAGYRLKWTELPVGRIYLQLQRGELDLWVGIGNMPQMQPFTVETTAKLGDITMAAFGFKDVPEQCEFADLAGNRLILMSGYTYLGNLESLKNDGTTRFDYAPNHSAGLGMLSRGRGDYFLNYVEPLSAVLASQPVAQLKWCELRKSRLAILVSRKTLNHQTIIDQLDAQLSENRLLINP